MKPSDVELVDGTPKPEIAEDLVRAAADEECDATEVLEGELLAVVTADGPRAARRPWFQNRCRWWRWEERDGEYQVRPMGEGDIRRRSRATRP